MNDFDPVFFDDCFDLAERKDDLYGVFYFHFVRRFNNPSIDQNLSTLYHTLCNSSSFD